MPDQPRGAYPTPKCAAAPASNPRSPRKPRAAPGLGGRQLAAEELRGGGVGGVQPGASCRVRGRSAVLVVQREADAAGEALHRLGERDVVHLA